MGNLTSPPTPSMSFSSSNSNGVDAPAFTRYRGEDPGSDSENLSDFESISSPDFTSDYDGLLSGLAFKPKSALRTTEWLKLQAIVNEFDNKEQPGVFDINAYKHTCESLGLSQDERLEHVLRRIGQYRPIGLNWRNRLKVFYDHYHSTLLADHGNEPVDPAVLHIIHCRIHILLNRWRKRTEIGIFNLWQLERYTLEIEKPIFDNWLAKSSRYAFRELEATNFHTKVVLLRIIGHWKNEAFCLVCGKQELMSWTSRPYFRKWCQKFLMLKKIENQAIHSHEQHVKQCILASLRNLHIAFEIRGARDAQIMKWVFCIQKRKASKNNAQNEAAIAIYIKTLLQKTLKNWRNVIEKNLQLELDYQALYDIKLQRKTFTSWRTTTCVHVRYETFLVNVRLRKLKIYISMWRWLVAANMDAEAMYDRECCTRVLTLWRFAARFRATQGFYNFCKCIDRFNQWRVARVGTVYLQAKYEEAARIILRNWKDGLQKYEECEIMAHNFLLSASQTRLLPQAFKMWNRHYKLISDKKQKARLFCAMSLKAHVFRSLCKFESKQEISAARAARIYSHNLVAVIIHRWSSALFKHQAERLSQILEIFEENNAEKARRLFFLRWLSSHRRIAQQDEAIKSRRTIEVARRCFNSIKGKVHQHVLLLSQASELVLFSAHRRIVHLLQAHVVKARIDAEECGIMVELAELRDQDRFFKRWWMQTFIQICRERDAAQMAKRMVEAERIKSFRRWLTASLGHAEQPPCSPTPSRTLIETPVRATRVFSPSTIDRWLRRNGLQNPSIRPQSL